MQTVHIGNARETDDCYFAFVIDGIRSDNDLIYGAQEGRFADSSSAQTCGEGFSRVRSDLSGMALEMPYVLKVENTFE